MKKIRFHNLRRMFRYAVGGLSLFVLHLLIRKGPRKAAAFLVRTGRMKDRDFGRGLPLVTVREILRKLQGNKPFTVELKASNVAGISGNPNNTLPQYLIGLIAAAVRPLYALEIGTGSGGATCQIAAQLREGG